MSESQSEYKVTNKNHALIAMLVICAIAPFADFLASSSRTAFTLVAIARSIAILVCCIIWVHIDSREKNIKIGPGFRIAMVVLLPVALIWYFYKSRGARRGTKTLLKALLFYFILALIYGVIATVLEIATGSKV